MAQKKHQQKGGTGMGAAVGLGAALAAAAGAYWLYGAKDAAKNRKLARSWMLKARAEVMDKLEHVQHIDRKQYMAIVDSAVAAAARGAAATRPEVARLKRDLGSAWTHIAKNMQRPASAKKAAKKPRRTAKKKAA